MNVMTSSSGHNIVAEEEPNVYDDSEGVERSLTATIDSQVSYDEQEPTNPSTIQKETRPLLQ